MPWREALKDPEFQKTTISFITSCLSVVIPVINHYRIRQLQAHVRCDKECQQEHAPRRRDKGRVRARA